MRVRLLLPVMTYNTQLSPMIVKGLDYKDSLPALTTEQRDILYGMLRDDAHAPRRGRHARIEFLQGINQLAFVEHLFWVFRAWTWLPKPFIGQRRGTGYGFCRFETFRHKAFDSFRDAFYPASKDPTRPPSKVIPDGVDQWFNARVLAYHIMCDGYLKGSNLILCTQGFSYDHIVRYADGIHAVLGIRPRPQGFRSRSSRGWVLLFPARALPELQGLLRPYILPTFYYKLGLLV